MASNDAIRGLREKKSLSSTPAFASFRRVCDVLRARAMTVEKGMHAYHVRLPELSLSNEVNGPHRREGCTP